MRLYIVRQDKICVRNTNVKVYMHLCSPLWLLHEVSTCVCDIVCVCVFLCVGVIDHTNDVIIQPLCGAQVSQVISQRNTSQQLLVCLCVYVSGWCAHGASR